MNFLAALFIQLALVLFLRPAADVEVQSAEVGLYGHDRYDGLSEICLKPMDFGHCRAKVKRYYFDIRRMKCSTFYFGGCAGNENNFKSLEECNKECYSAFENDSGPEEEYDATNVSRGGVLSKDSQNTGSDSSAKANTKGYKSSNYPKSNSNSRSSNDEASDDDYDN